MMITIAMNISVVVMMTMTIPPVQAVLLCINIPIIIFTGYRYYKAAWMGARHGAYGMDALVVVGTTLSFFFSCFLLAVAFNSSSSGSDNNNNRNFFVTSGMLLMFVTIGKFIEG
jgi:Cu+-exporting ATPase